MCPSYYVPQKCVQQQFITVLNYQRHFVGELAVVNFQIDKAIEGLVEFGYCFPIF